MAEPDLNLIMERLLAIQTDMREMRADIAEMKATMVDIGDGLTVVSHQINRLERDMVRIKDMLGKMDARLVHLEQRP